MRKPSTLLLQLALWLALGAEPFVSAAVAEPLAVAEAGGYRLELLSVDEAAPAQGRTPAVGWQLLSLHVALHNTTAAPLLQFEPADNAVLLEDGLFPYYAQRDHPDAEALARLLDLPVGGKADGRLLFEVPIEHGPLNLLVSVEGNELAVPLSPDQSAPVLPVETVEAEPAPPPLERDPTASSEGNETTGTSAACLEQPTEPGSWVGQNGLIRIGVERLCFLPEVGGAAAGEGRAFALVEGQISNLSTDSEIQLPPPSQLLVLLADGHLARPQAELDATLAPGFADRPLSPGVSRDFAVAFAIPEQGAESLVLLHPGQSDRIELALAGVPLALDGQLAGPVTVGPLQVAVAAVTTPPEGGAATIGLRVRNTLAQSFATALQDFVQLVEPGGYLHDPAPSGEATEFLPGAVQAVDLAFDLPAGVTAGELVFFGEAVPMVLPLGDPNPPPPPALAASGAGGLLGIELLGLTPRAEDADVLVFDLRLELRHDDPAVVLAFEPATAMQLHLDDGSVVQAETNDGLPRRFGSTTFHPGQPGRGELAFRLPAGRLPAFLLLPFAQQPARLDLPVAVLPPGWRTEPVAPEPVPAVPTVGLSLDKTELMARERLRISFVGAAGLPVDAWLGIVPAATPHGSESANEAAALASFYLEGATEGSFATRAPEAPGAYEVRLHDSDSNGTELLAVGFTVLGAAPAPAPAPQPAPMVPEPVTTGPPEIVLPGGDWAAPDSTVTAQLVLHGPLPDAWLGLVPSDVPHGDENVIDGYDIAYAYVRDLPDGLWTFTVPTTPGRYDVRVMQDTSGGPDLAWASFVVSAAPPLGEVKRLDLAEAINVAQPAFGAFAEGGRNLEFLFDGVPQDYRELGYTVTELGKPITVQLDRAYALERVRFLLWDLDDRTFGWTLEGSIDGAQWSPLADSGGENRNGWQEIALDGRPWLALRLTAITSSGDSQYYLIEFEAYARLQVPASALAMPIGAVDWPSRSDLTLGLWGGRVLQASSGETTAGAAVDGVLQEGGWQAAADDQQPSLIFAFNGDAAGRVGGVALELPEGTGRPRLIELQVSDDSTGDDWRALSTIAVPPQGRFLRANFPAEVGRRARLLITARYPGAAPPALAEVALLEQVDHHSASVLPFYRDDFQGGLNIATYHLWAQIVRISDESEPDVGWGMLDRYTDHQGWRTSAAAFPQEAVVSFHSNAEAWIGAVSLYNPIQNEPAENGLRRFEIWTSTAETEGGFVLVGTYEAEAGAGFQIFAFAPRAARFVKLRALSNWGGARLALSEFEVLEVATPQVPTLLPVEMPPLNDSAFGGHMAVAAGTGRWALLTWWYLQEGAWQSDAGAAAPIDLVFGFGGTGDPWFERIGLRSGSAHAPQENWVRRLKVYVSPDSPIDNFTQVADLTLQRSNELQWFDLPAVQGRYLRLRILENHGGQGFSLGELALPEQHSADRLSALARRYEDDLKSPSAGTDQASDGNERNDVVALATSLPLGRETEGLIAPPTDVDFWRIDTGGQPLPGLEVAVSEEPALRIGLRLLDAAGVELDRQPLYETAGSQAELFWALPQGRYHLAIDRPESSVVVLSDLSPSTDDVRPQINRALSSFVERVGDFEEIAIAGFCGSIDLAADFINDRQALRQAVASIDYGCNGTDLYGAVVQAIDWLEQRSGTKAILLITDGAQWGDHEASLYAVWERLLARNVRIYSIGYGGAIGWDISPQSEQRAGFLGQTGGDLLRSWAAATGGGYFDAPSGEAIEQVVEEISRALRDPSHYRLTASAPAGEGLLRVFEVGEAIESVAAPRRLEIIFDASGSMWGQIEGRTKIEIARDVIRSVVATLPPESELALRVYGHRYPSKPKKRSCEDSELVVPFGPNNHQRIIDAIFAVKPNGQTPIGLSLAWLSEDFRGLEGQNQVILVTDGIESCDADPGDRYYPPAIVARLLELGYQMTVSVVGFDIGESATREFLLSIAETGHGEYFDASNTAELEEALRSAVRAGYEVHDGTGRLVGEGEIGGEPLRLPNGLYDIMLSSDPPRTIEDVRIAQDRATWVLLDREGDNIGISVEEHGLNEVPAQ